MNIEDFKRLYPTLPAEPGVYKFIDENDKLIYVGKSKNIRNRVSYYFKTGYDNFKTYTLVKKATRIDFTIVKTEQDALLLENLLIKENQPRYNIQLRDDKTYPHVCIKKERFPRVFLTRTRIDDGSEYLGPYTSVKRVRTIIQLLQNIFPLRTCNLNLSQKKIDAGKYKVCLEYHIGNCLGPCENKQTEESYNENIAHIRSILKGHISPVLQQLKKQMQYFSERLEFEKASVIKSKIEALENYQSKSTVVSPSIDNVDVFSIIDSGKSAFVNYLKVVNGGIIQAKTIELRKKLNETLEELLIFAITALRQEFHSNSEELIVPFEIQLPDESLLITVPQRGDKRKLLELSVSNAAYYKQSRESAKPKGDNVLQILQKDFRLTSLPVHIECFDNSNFQGAYPVSALVVFRNGKPSKKDYRHFNIKTVTGPDDFASMEEVVYRRYYGLLQQNAPLPQLIIIDGGKGQLSAARNALIKLRLDGKIPIAGIAKRLEEIYFPDDPLPMHLDKRSPALKLIQRIRDEAHRFAITFHTKKRDAATLKTSLTEIPGIGRKTSELLLKTFKSEKKLRQASLDELAALLGEAKAKKVAEFFSAIPAQ
ncbi:MAG TPA: excinuclease ABC subunit UvrC [Chitinophagales bacterium]|nr:excinuclease ABC subunit UvrC [Chitinophagales bacterium]